MNKKEYVFKKVRKLYFFFLHVKDSLKTGIFFLQVKDSLKTDFFFTYKT